MLHITQQYLLCLSFSIGKWSLYQWSSLEMIRRNYYLCVLCAEASSCSHYPRNIGNLASHCLHYPSSIGVTVRHHLLNHMALAYTFFYYAIHLNKVCSLYWYINQKLWHHTTTIDQNGYHQRNSLRRVSWSSCWTESHCHANLSESNHSIPSLLS